MLSIRFPTSKTGLTRFQSMQQGKAVVSKAKAYLQVRHQALRGALQQLGLDAMLLTVPADLSYLTDFTGEDSVGLFTRDGSFWLITDFRYKQQSKEEVGWMDIHVREADMADALAKVLRQSKATKVGFEANGATVGQIRAIERAMETAGKKGASAAAGNGAGRPELVPVEDVLITLRKVKDD